MYFLSMLACVGCVFGVFYSVEEGPSWPIPIYLVAAVIFFFYPDPMDD